MWTALSIAVFLGLLTGINASICAPDKVATYETECVNALKSKIVDDNAYWFGTDFELKCPEAEWDTPACFNTLGSSLLGSSIAGLSGISNANIDRTVSAIYTAQPGSYVGCDHAYTLSEEYQIPVDPLSGEALAPFEVRSLPSLTWTTEANKQYSFILLDVAFNFIHAMYINIEGNDISTGMAVVPYQPPRFPLDMENLYLVLIYEQSTNDMSGVTALEATLTTEIDPRTSWKLGDYTAQDGLNGPIAVNMLLIEKDPYAVQMISTGAGTVNNCVPFVEEAYESAQVGEVRPWLPAIPDFSVFLRIEFTNAEDFSFDYCCKTTTYEARSFFLDPLDVNSRSLAGELSTRSTRRVILEANVMNPDPSTDFANKQYTLMDVAPDIHEDYGIFGDNDRPLQMWMSVNNVVSSSGQLTITDELVSYLAAVPPTNDEMPYYFLLYEQTGSITVDDISAYSNDSCGLPGRCRFDVSKFVSDYNLDLVGISWTTCDRTVDRYCDFYDELEESTVCGPAFAECSGAQQVAVTSVLWIVTGVVMSLLSRGI